MIMYVLGRFGPVRSIMLLAYRKRGRTMASIQGTSLLEDVDAEHAANAISKDGYFPGLRLRPEALAALHQFCTNSICFAEENFRLPFTLSVRAIAERRYKKKIRIGRFDDVLLTCSEVQALASDPAILAIARNYLGCQPVLLGSRMWWSFATDESASPEPALGQGFHYDVDGYRAVAFFFYLTEVDPSTGPHVCVRGSHLKKPWKSLVSLHRGRGDADIESWYGKERVEMLCGPAGYGFAEDIFCFHKGLHPERGDRLVLQLRYGIHRYENGF
jgi:hypothetical protein